MFAKKPNKTTTKDLLRATLEWKRKSLALIPDVTLWRETSRELLRVIDAFEKDAALKQIDDEVFETDTPEDS